MSKIVKTREKNIRRFIGEENPTPKELRYFCKLAPLDPEMYKYVKDWVQMMCKFKSNTYQKLRITGYYGTNIRQWGTNGNIEVVDGRYQLTEIAKKNGNTLYTETKDAKIARLTRRTNKLVKEVWETRDEVTKAYKLLDQARTNFDYFINGLYPKKEDIPWYVRRHTNYKQIEL